MNLKLFMPLTALALIAASCQSDEKGLTKGSGTISPEFTVDYTVNNPRNENSRAEGGSEQASVIPSINDFSFHLVKDDGKYEKTVTGLGEFTGTQFPVGAYSLEAYYGDIEQEGIDKAYFYGSTTFKVYDGEEAQPALVAMLANTAVSVEYTEAFKNYFTEYSTEVHSSNGTAYVDLTSDNAGWAYLKPGDVSIAITVTKQNGVTGTVEAAKITNAAPGTHYHVTVDANGGEVGSETITVSFDASTVLEPIEIPVDILVTPAPVITPVGFTSGTAIEILEGDAAEGSLKVSVLAEGGLQNVILTTTTPTAAMSALAGDVDLMAATDVQKNALQAVEVECMGLWNNPDKMAVIDFTKMLKYLTVADGVSTHTFAVKVVDKLNKTCEPVVLTVNAPKPVLTISNPAELHFGDATASFDFYYNGKDLENKVVFQVNNAMGVLVNTTIASANPIGDNLYRVTINIPDSDDDLRVMATYNNTNSDVVTIKRIVSVVANDYDVWATSAMIQIAPSSLYNKVSSVSLNGTTRSETFNSMGQCTFTGLTAGTHYNVEVTLENGNSYTASFDTENAVAVPNGDFENIAQTINVSSINQGGTWSSTSHWTAQQTTTSYNVSEPTGWASVNAKTCCLSAATQNTWFVVPSTFNTSEAQSGSTAMTLRNVGWDLNGSVPGRSTNTNNTNYSKNSATVANRAAGKLFLGTYSFNSSSSSEAYTEGVEFGSRPSALNGFYKYTRDGNDATEQGVVTVTLLNGSTVIATGTANLDPASDFTSFTASLNYSNSKLKATTLKIMITSSNHASYNMSDETSSIKTTDHMSETEQVTRGAQLTVDNLTFTY